MLQKWAVRQFWPFCHSLSRNLNWLNPKPRRERWRAHLFATRLAPGRVPAEMDNTLAKVMSSRP